MQINFVDLKRQLASIQDELSDAMKRVMDKADFVLGEELALFETEFATYCGTTDAVGVDNGTSALELALRAYNIGVGDEVITTANTFIATASAITFTGARPVLVDIDPITYNIDVSRIEATISPKTRAIMPVHLYGQMADMDSIMEIAHKHNLVVIEDACQAHGAKYNGRRAGSIGNTAAFSFYPSKNLGALGDGGMVVTNDKEIGDKVRILRNYGQSQKYHHLFTAYNRRLDTLQAAVLRVKLRYLDGWNAARRWHAALYTQLLANSEVAVPTQADTSESVYHLYVIRVKERGGLEEYLKTRGISTGVHYPIPIHLQPAYRDLGYRRGDLPTAEMYADQILSLPMFPELTKEEIKYTCDCILQFQKRMRKEAALET